MANVRVPRQVGTLIEGVYLVSALLSRACTKECQFVLLYIYLFRGQIYY